MAARTRKIQHAEKTKDLIRASQLLNRLTSHANGEIELSASQVQSARIVIGKVIPDLKAIEHSGGMEIRGLADVLASISTRNNN